MTIGSVSTVHTYVYCIQCADPDPFYMDTDPACHFDTDPVFQFDTDPDVDLDPDPSISKR